MQPNPSCEAVIPSEPNFIFFHNVNFYTGSNPVMYGVLINDSILPPLMP